MMAQDLTKFTLMIVLVGAGLAMAIFRPQILPPGLVEPTSQPVLVEGTTPVPSPTEVVPLEPTASPQQRQDELDQREAALDEREQELSRRQAEFDGRGADLARRTAELDGREAYLKGREADLRSWEESLNDYKGRLEQQRADLLRQASALAEREQALQGFLRWATVAVVVCSLVGISSVLLLIVVVWRGQPIAGASQAHRNGWGAQRVRQPTGAPAPTFGGNGRDKEGVRHGA